MTDQIKLLYNHNNNVVVVVKMTDHIKLLYNYNNSVVVAVKLALKLY